MSTTSLYSLVIYVPEDHKEKLKEALFAAGAGHYGNYDRCSWETSGTGQFRPLAESSPFIGEKMTTQQVKEYRLELICQEDALRQVVSAIKAVHPYEVPAFHILKMFQPN